MKSVPQKSNTLFMHGLRLQMCKSKTTKQQKKTQKFTVFSIWPHVLIYITSYFLSHYASWIELLAVHCLWQFSADTSRQPASVASRRDIWFCGWWSYTFHLQAGNKNPKWGWGKWKPFLDGLQTRFVIACEWWNATLSHAFTNVLVFPPTCSLFVLLAVVGGGHLKTKGGARCCRDQLGISAGPNQHFRLQHTPLWPVASTMMFLPRQRVFAKWNPDLSAQMI